MSKLSWFDCIKLAAIILLYGYIETNSVDTIISDVKKSLR